MIPKRDCNMDMLSESEIECIQQTISVFGEMSFGQLVDVTHDSAWNVVEENETIPIDAIVATLPNAAEVAGYLRAH